LIDRFEFYFCDVRLDTITALWQRVTHVDQINALSGLDRNRGVRLALQSAADIVRNVQSYSGVVLYAGNLSIIHGGVHVREILFIAVAR